MDEESQSDQARPADTDIVTDGSASPVTPQSVPEPSSPRPAAEVADQWTSTVVLGDGSAATIRPITPDDAPRLQAFHARQSNESNYYRYFSPKPTMSDREAQRFTHVDFVGRVALVMEDHGELIAWASYERWTGRPDAEVAFQVDDAYRGRGIATLMLEHLAAIARTNGIDRFTAETLADNRSMLTVFTKAGWPLQRRFESGVIDVDFPLEASPEFSDSVERREQRADSRAVARILVPRSIAVIGASDRVGSIGHELWVHSASVGRIPHYPVNARHDTVGGVRAYRSVTEIDDDVDLAVIAVAPDRLPDVVEECIAKRVRGAVLITAPDRGTDEFEALIRHARRNGLRIVGPASMGIASPLPEVSINATLVDVTLAPGPIAISTQSGTLGASVLRLARDLGIGLSWFVSLGDKGDISSNDLLQFWQDDDATRVICLYTESVGNPRKFGRIAHRVARDRPIIVVRTGAALFGTANDALYRRSGVIEVPTVQAMLDTARVVAHQPRMLGDRVAVIANARSPRAAAAATLTAAGLEPVEPPRQLDWRATPDDYADAVAQAIASDHIDAIIVVHAPPTEADVGAPARAIAHAAATASTPIPITAVMLGLGDGPLVAASPVAASPNAASPGQIASFAFPEQAAAALARLRNYSLWRDSEAAEDDEDEIVGIDRPRAHSIISAELDAVANPEFPAHPAAGRPRPEAVREILASYGIEMPETRLVVADDAVQAARAIGYPVAVKALGREAGTSVKAGIGLDLADDDDVVAAVREMTGSLHEGAAQVWVQAMVEPGYELRATAELDDRYGPMVSVGLGGFEADVIGDRTSRIAPMSSSAARQLLADTRASAALDEADTDAVVDLSVRLAQLVSDHPEIKRFDLNPIIVHNGTAIVVDADLALGPPSIITPATRRLEAD